MVGRAPTAQPKPIKVRSAAKSSNRVKAAKPTVAQATASGAVPAPKSTTRRRVKVETRTRIYWAVFNPDLKRVAVFEYDQRMEADKRAQKLSDATGGAHFVQKIKATVNV